MKRRNGVLFTLAACAAAAILPALANPASDGPSLNLSNCKGFLDGKGGDRAHIVIESEEVRRKGKNFVVRRGDEEIVVDRKELETYLLLRAYKYRTIKANYQASGERVVKFVNDPASRGKVLVSLEDGDVQEVAVLTDGRIRVRACGGKKLVHEAVYDLATLNANVEKGRLQGQLVACKSNLKNLATALEMYASDWGGRYPEALDPPLISGNYLRRIPTCPAAGSTTYQYGVAANPDRFTMACQGHHHAKAAMKENMPGYSSENGLLEESEP